MAWVAARQAVHRWWLVVLIDIGLVAAGAVELLLETRPAWTFDFAWGVLGLVAILTRQRLRWVSFLATLPALYVTGILIPTLITLFAVAERSRRRWMLFAASAVVAVLWLSPWDYAPRLGVLLDAIYAAMFGMAPTVLGLLVQTRRDLSQKLVELTEARRVERESAERQIVAAERARIAREMHDVVSHQVSLIAVQAGALQVATDDRQTAEAAKSIRLLSVRTLDELRHMVGVLRASGSGATELTPQPTLSELDRLVSASGVQASVLTEPPPGLPPTVQRALFRAVQEGLTNVRKHAPGAVTTIMFSATSRVVVLVVENGPSVEERTEFPSSRHGLIGLRERADLLGGSLATERLDNGGFRLRVTLPLSGEPGA
ncbi:sensor histidine kinase [Humibacter ginsenosidimutans]|uniref:histidine kinase n=1 Tax=Humibacter ginsenosidimutans TaxID=2599293 RepID=A0A5B8M679_9MICO|nr:histidine kinase [Humibacter ginsenosidimutans]QDZ15275.1 two-component sensor histidine kinase [Humibacter ginsenosidimutans]